MKKYLVFWIIIAVIVFLLIVNFFFHITYFNNFKKNTRAPTIEERQRIIGILNKTIKLQDYQIKMGNVYAAKDKSLVQVELITNHSKIYYVVDLKRGNILKK
jgi:hypothetical protein